MLPDVALRVFAHASSAEKHFIEMTERSCHRGFPLAVWMLADGGPFDNQFSPKKCFVKHPREQVRGILISDSLVH